jgi:hypothetical protein
VVNKPRINKNKEVNLFVKNYSNYEVNKRVYDNSKWLILVNVTNKTLGSIQSGEILDWPKNFWLLHEDSVPWSCLLVS